MANSKSVKTAAKMKTSRKDPTVVISKSDPANMPIEESKLEVSIKQAAGTIRALMSLPPPTGQPIKPPGKGPRF
jgi:hypothetical protein